MKAWFENEDGDIEWTEIFVDEDEGKKTPTVDRHRYLPLLAKLSAHKLVPVKE